MQSIIIPGFLGSFTMETILAIAFGHNSDEKVSESDNLMKAVKSLSQQIEEGRITSFATLIMLISKPLSHFFCSDYLVLKEGEDQRSQSLYGTMVIPLAQGEALVQQLSFSIVPLTEVTRFNL